MKVVLFSLAILLAEANPIELPARILSQTCGDYEWFNPRANTCQGFAVPSSCGLLAKTCGSGEYCTNNDGWSNNAMDWDCCPQGQVFSTTGTCVDYMDIVGGCGSDTSACSGGAVCSVDPKYNGLMSMDDGTVTAASWSVSCCPDTKQWDTDRNECRDFTANDSCGVNFDQCTGLDNCVMIDGKAGSINDINNFACENSLWWSGNYGYNDGM